MSHYGLRTGTSQSWMAAVCLIAVCQPFFIQAAEPAAQPPQPVAVEKILPAKTVFLWHDEGYTAHAKAYAQTAASDAFSATGVYTVAGKWLTSLIDLSGGAEEQETANLLGSLIRAAINDGFTISVAFPDDPKSLTPELLIVVHRGGSLAKSIAKLAGLSADDNPDSPPPPPKEEDVKAESKKAGKPQKRFLIENGGKDVILIPEPEFDGSKSDESDADKSDAADSESDKSDKSEKSPQVLERQIEQRTVWTIPEADILPWDDKQEMSCWNEGGHLVLAFGADAMHHTISVANGKVPGIVTHRLWKAAHQDEVGFSRRSLGWIDISGVSQAMEDIPLATVAALLEETVGISVSSSEDSSESNSSESDSSDAKSGNEAEKKDAEKKVVQTAGVADELPTLKALATRLGLDGIDAWTWQSGYRGRAQWSESAWRTVGEPRGLLALKSSRTMIIDDLPPLPANIDSFFAMTVDLKAIVHGGATLLNELAPLAGKNGSAEVVKSLDELRKQVDVKTIGEIVSALDVVVCSYNDNSNGPLTFGPVVAWKIKDPAKLRIALNRFLDAAAKPKSESKPDATPQQDKSAPKAKADPATPPVDDDDDGDDASEKEEESKPIKVTRIKRYGHELTTIDGSVSLAIHGQWLVASINPQLVEAFLLRADGKLPHWQLTDAHRTALKELPDRFTSITIDDPRRSLPFWMSTIPGALSLMTQPIITESVKINGQVDSVTKRNILGQEVPAGTDPGGFDLTEFPPAELIIQPLFPNVTVTTSDEKGWHSYSRTSVNSPSLWNAAVGVIVLGIATDGEILDVFNILF